MADFNSKYSGEQVEAILDSVANGEAGGGGGGGITVETDPVFSASPAASITEEKKAEWDNKMDNVTLAKVATSGSYNDLSNKPTIPTNVSELNNDSSFTPYNQVMSILSGYVKKEEGKGLSTQDFTTELEGKLKGIEANAQKNVQSDWSENDMGSDAYVNNRTHYSYEIEQVTSFSIASKNEGDILVTGLLDGAFYRIYNKAGSKNEAFYFVEGRKVVIPSNGPTIEAVCAYEDDFCLKLTTPTYGMTESFSLMEIHVEQLDDVYIPKTIARKDEILQGEKGEQGEQGPKGDDGIGIASVAQTTTSSADGGSNVMTVTLSNGTKSTFTVKNGSKGSQGEQGPKGDKGDKGDTGPEGPKGDKGDKGDTGATGTNGKDGADGATFTPSVDANGNLSWTNNKGLTNPPTVNIKGPKGDSGEGGGSSSDGRKEVIYVDMESTITSMRPNVIYWIVGFGDISIESFEEPVYGVDTYDVFTAIIEIEQYGDTVSLTLPDYVWWANGVNPEIGAGEYELSISRISDGDHTRYYAVLTPFKPL